MLTRAYTLRFVTPAFLGNADQNGQWRTPPIKSLLRQWWRVACMVGQRGRIDDVAVRAMRAAEGALFGVAADSEGDSRKSQVRLRLNRWDKGRLGSWAGSDIERVTHPEVKGKDGRLAPVGAMLYLGYGPLVFAQGQTALKARAAIQAGEDALFNLAFPAGDEGARLDLALWLMHRYGTLGGRSRNGWGSFSLTPADAATPALDGELVATLTTPWRDALSFDWPHAIGRDDHGPLIWQTEIAGDWKVAMRRLAEIKIGLRTQSQFRFATGKNAEQPEARHWLSYPVTHHSVREWDRLKARLPNSLRFKVRAERDGKLRGVIFHVPCKPPAEFRPDLAAIQEVWQKVHVHLDQREQKLERIAG